jgi:predicted dehydrogenase
VRDTVRVSVIGAGAIAQVAHLVVLRKLENVELTGLCDSDLPKAHALARRFEIPDVYDDIEDLIRYAEPDAVVVCTPNHLHEDHVISALSAGVPVLCERPLALTVGGVERVMERAARADVPVMVGMNHRFRDDVQAVRSFLVGGELGALRSVRAHWHIFRPAGAPAGWRVRQAESGGGAMMDLGLPLVDLALWLSQCPATKRVSAVFGAAPDRHGVEDIGAAFMQCEEGHSTFIDVSWRHMGPQERFALEVAGDLGSAAIAPLSVFKEMHGAPVNVTPPAEVIGDPFSNSYRAEWEFFLEVLRGTEARPDLGEQLQLHRTMEAIRQSASEGREITL